MTKRRGPTVLAGRSLNRRSSALGHAEAQNAVYVGPWLLLLFIAFAGQTLHTLFATSSGLLSVLEILGVVIGMVLLGWAGEVGSHDRTLIGRIHTLSTIGLAGVWLIIAMVQGVFAFEDLHGWWPWPVLIPQRPTIDLWVVIGGAVAVAWNMRQGVRVSEARTAKIVGESLDDWGEAGFSGVKGEIRRKNEFRGEGTFQLPKGMYLEQLQRGAKAIESAKGYPMGSLTLLPHASKHPRKVHAVVMYKNPLEGAVNWPGVIG